MIVKHYSIADIFVDISYAEGMSEPENFAPFEALSGLSAVPDHEIIVHTYDEDEPPVASEDTLEMVSFDIVNELFLASGGDRTLIKKTRMREGDPRVMWTFMKLDDLKRADVYVPSTWIDYQGIANSFMFEKMLLSHGSVMLHCALIESEGRGIAFTAPSQTGKSTQANLWAEHRNARELNGDRAIIRVFDDGVYAYGSPWAGSSAIYVNERVRLDAIVALFQSKQNTATQLAYQEALQYFLIGTSLPTFDETLLQTGLDTIERVLSGTSLVKLGCTPDVRAVDALDDYLRRIKHGGCTACRQSLT